MAHSYMKIIASWMIVLCCCKTSAANMNHGHAHSVYSPDVHPLLRPFTDSSSSSSRSRGITSGRARIVPPELDSDISFNGAALNLNLAIDDVSFGDKNYGKDRGFEEQEYEHGHGHEYNQDLRLNLHLASPHNHQELSTQLQAQPQPPFVHNITPPQSYANECSFNDENYDHHMNMNMNMQEDSPTLSSSSSLESSLKSKYLKTGTTIVGIQTSTHVILAADTRATEGTVVADTRCDKVHQLARNVWCCGAGTSGDLDALTRKVRYTFLLRSKVQNSIGNGVLMEDDHNNNDDDEREDDDDDDDKDDNTNDEKNDNRNASMNQYRSQEEKNINQTLGEASIASICNMIREELYKNGGGIGANLVLGGVDANTHQPILTAIHPHGSIDRIPYTALGSGGLAAMGVLESRYTPDISLEDAICLVKDAVHAGITNDLGSGSQVDICIIGPNGKGKGSHSRTRTRTETVVTHKRGVVPEETLRLSSGDKSMENKLFQRHTSDYEADSMGGVNGFGSLPYKVTRRKMVLLDEQVIRRDRDKWLHGIIMGDKHDADVDDYDHDRGHHEI